MIFWLNGSDVLRPIMTPNTDFGIFYHTAIVHLDESVQVPVALRSGHLCRPSYLDDRGASARVRSFLLSFPRTRELCSSTSHQLSRPETLLRRS